MTEHELYQDDKTLWACLLMMKYTHKKEGWKKVRDAIRETLGDDGMATLTEAWKQAKTERKI